MGELEIVVWLVCFFYGFFGVEFFFRGCNGDIFIYNYLIIMSCIFFIFLVYKIVVFYILNKRIRIYFLSLDFDK